MSTAMVSPPVRKPGGSLSPEQLEVVRRMYRDYRYYAEKCLKVLDKNAQLVPFKFNAAQNYAHERIEEQHARIKRVRAIVLKGRQQGISTYIQGRCRWRLKHRKGIKAYVLAHEQRASDNMFNMARRFHDHEPIIFQPSLGRSNAKELWFDKLDSRYEVATAGTKDVGRSGMAHFIHASEYAFWPNADTHWAGIGQVIPDMDGTEFYVESTANGLQNDFYRRWQKTMKGECGDFIGIFVPWFWQPEYRRPVPANFALESDEESLVDAYGWDMEQVAWRRNKIEQDFGGDATRFYQEYPSNWHEAFQSELRDVFIPPSLVIAAQAREQMLVPGPLVVGVDPARFGDDRTAVVVRRGRVVVGYKRYAKKDTMEVAGIVARFIMDKSPDRVFIDTVGLGAGVYDRLVELGFGPRDKGIVESVQASETAHNDEVYRNRRAELWGEMKAWMQEGGVCLPKGDEWLADMTCPGYKYDSSGRLIIESKDDIRKDGRSSPDLADALSLTFASPVIPKQPRRPVPSFGVVDPVVGY